MFQQIIALVIITFFIVRLLPQRKKDQISKNEFYFWLIFWLGTALAVIFIKVIDQIVLFLGFSGSGINFLLYLAIMMLFYFIFRMRLRIVKMDKELTKIARKIALEEVEK
jgi:hypothetical protein